MSEHVYGISMARRSWRSPGRLLLSALAAVVSVGPWFVDYNETHIFNPAWPPHAKYHNAQTLILATVSGLACLWLLWSPRRAREAGGDPVARVGTAAFVGSMYWLTMVPAILVPNTAHADPEFADRLPRLFGATVNQFAIGLIWLALVGLGWWLERRRLLRMEGRR